MPWTVSTDPALPPRVAELLESIRQWDAERWHKALQAAALPLHRVRRASSRPLCEAILADQGNALGCWMTRDAVRTAVEALAPLHRRVDRERRLEILEDGALAMLARPALPLVDLAVLLGPCLPLRAD